MAWWSCATDRSKPAAHPAGRCGRLYSSVTFPKPPRPRLPRSGFLMYLARRRACIMERDGHDPDTTCARLTMSAAIAAATLAIAQCGGSNTGPSGGGNTSPSVSSVVLTPASAAPGALVSGTVTSHRRGARRRGKRRAVEQQPGGRHRAGNGNGRGRCDRAAFTAIAVGAGTVAITASFGPSRAIAATLTVAAPAVVLSSLSLSASLVTGGNPVTRYRHAFSGRTGGRCRGLAVGRRPGHRAGERDGAGGLDERVVHHRDACGRRARRW